MPTLKPRHIIYLILGTLCLILLTSAAYYSQLKLRGEDAAFFFVLIPAVGTFLCFATIGYAVGKCDGYQLGYGDGSRDVNLAAAKREDEAHDATLQILKQRSAHLDATNDKLRSI